MDGLKRKRVLILGGGFGGVYTAMSLDGTLARSEAIEVTLVSRENFFLFTPMLHEVAAGDLDITHIVSPIRQLVKRVNFIEAEVQTIDLDNKRVSVVHGHEQNQRLLEYDYLVVALGGVTNFYKLPGVQENALTMKTLGDAIYLRNRVIQVLEQCEFDSLDGGRVPRVTIVQVGGGYAGVETLASINDFVRESARFYPGLSQEAIRVVLVHDRQYLLPEIGEELGAYAQEKLSQQKVEVLVKTSVLGVSERGVELDNGSAIPTDVLIWTAGMMPDPLLSTLKCKTDRGRIVVNEFMEVPEFPGVWALGDCALIPDPTGKPYPPTAQHATREAKVLALNLTACVTGGSQKRAFVFKNLGSLAALGRRSAVARILGWNFSGFIAWWLWRTIYLFKLPRLDRKIRVILDWTLDMVFPKDLVQFMTRRAPTISSREGNVN